MEREDARVGQGRPERLKKLEVRSSSRYLRWEGTEMSEETVTAISGARRLRRAARCRGGAAESEEDYIALRQEH